MIRHIRRFLHLTLIVILTLAAVGTGVLWLDSYRKPRGHDLVYVGIQYVGGYHREWEFRSGQLEFEYEYNIPRRLGKPNVVVVLQLLGVQDRL